MDAFARGLLIAQRIIEDGVFDEFIAERYSSYAFGVGKEVMDGSFSLEKSVCLDSGKRGTAAPQRPPGNAGEYFESISGDIAADSALG